jgi:hypothetical protein
MQVRRGSFAFAGRASRQHRFSRLAPSRPPAAKEADMIAPLDHPIWENLLSREVEHKFSLFAANLKVEVASRAFAQNKANKSTLILELHEFFTKYEKLTAADLAKIM